MRLTTVLRKAAIVGLVVGVCGATGASASASASDNRYLSGECSKDNKTLSGTARYYYNSAEGDVFTRFTWNISGSVGSKNDVAIDVYVDKNNAVDPWEGGHYTDSAKKGSGSKTVHIIAPAKEKVYVRFGVDFDKANAVDPSCSFQTKRI
jgi:hypothetical protein